MAWLDRYRRAAEVLKEKNPLKRRKMVHKMIKETADEIGKRNPKPGTKGES